MFDYSKPTLVYSKGYRDKGNLYVGSVDSVKKISKYQIKAIVSMIEEQPKCSNQVHQLFISIQDSAETNIKQYFDKTQKYIDYWLKSTNVLVHCAVGISRSVSIIVAYLMKKSNKTPKQILQEIDKTRPGVGPNPGFMYQLEQLYAELHQYDQQQEKQQFEKH